MILKACCLLKAFRALGSTELSVRMLASTNALGQNVQTSSPSRKRSKT